MSQSLYNAPSSPAAPGRPAITTVFFDMGSTLARLRPSWQGIYHRVFQRAGYELPLDEVEAAVSYSWSIVAAQDHQAEYITSLEGNRAWQREIEERVMDRLNLHPDVREDVFWQLIEAFETPDSYELYPDSLPALTRLRDSGYRLAIISNWSWHLPELCEALGLTPYFEQIFTSARVGYPKPRPEIFRHALVTLGVEAGQALHIGDSLQADVAGALAAGIRAVWLVRPEEQPLYEDRALDGQQVDRLTGLAQLPDYLETVK